MRYMARIHSDSRYRMDTTIYGSEKTFHKVIRLQLAKVVTILTMAQTESLDLYLDTLCFLLTRINNP